MVMSVCVLKHVLMGLVPQVIDHRQAFACNGHMCLSLSCGQRPQRHVHGSDTKGAITPNLINTHS